MESVDLINGFFMFIKSDEVLNVAKLNSKAFTRQCKMDCEDIVKFMLTRGSGNTAVELDKYFNDMGVQPVSRQAYCISRQQIDPMVFKYLNSCLIDKVYEFKEYKTWNDYLILAVDGCLLDLPWIEELKDEYGGKTDKTGEIEVIKARSSGLFDCLNNIMIDFEIDPYQVSEKVLAIKNIENSIETIKKQKSTFNIR